MLEETHESMLAIIRKFYETDVFNKELLRAMVYRPGLVCQMYISEHEYKQITGEDWIPVE